MELLRTGSSSCTVLLHSVLELEALAGAAQRAALGTHKARAVPWLDSRLPALPPLALRSAGVCNVTSHAPCLCAQYALGLASDLCSVKLVKALFRG